MATTNNAATTKAKVETFEVSWQARKSDGKPFLMVKLWANGRQTHTVLMGDDKAHLAAILSGMAAAVNSFAEPMPAAKKAAAPVVAAAPTAAPDMAAMLAEMARLMAENAAMRGQSAETAPVVAAAPTSTQSRLSRIKARAK